MPDQQQRRVEEPRPETSPEAETGGAEDFGSNADRVASLEPAGSTSSRTEPNPQTTEPEPWWAGGDTQTASRAVTLELPFTLPSGGGGTIEIAYEVAWPQGAGSFDAFKKTQEAKFSADGRGLAASCVKSGTGAS
ncbi:MAG: hypothetical protein ABMB14_14990 [Myxococcota bacterium]